MRYGNAKGAGSRQQAAGRRRQAAYAGKAQNKQHKLFRQERERERQSEFKVQLQLQHISSESTVAWRHRTTQDAGHGTRGTEQTDRRDDS